MKLVIAFITGISFFSTAFAAATSVPLDKAPNVNHRDKASLQRGAKMFVNVCMGCHSMQYMRYQQMAKGAGIVDPQGKVLKRLVEMDLIFTPDTKIHDPMINAMAKDDAVKWFGAQPLDLTLVARVRGADWLYTYLRSFYEDEKGLWGVNNRIYNGVSMPNVMMDLQGVQKPVYKEEIIQFNGGTQTKKVIDRLEIVQPGSMSTEEFDKAVGDLVNFLTYAAEPVKITRQKIGLWVMLFLGVFLVLAIMLKREYWKDIK